MDIFLTSLISAFIFLKIKNLGPIFSMAFVKISFGAALLSFVSAWATSFLGLRINNVNNAIGLTVLIVGSLVGAWITAAIISNSNRSNATSNLEVRTATIESPQKTKVSFEVDQESPSIRDQAGPVFQKVDLTKGNEFERLDPELFFDLKDLIAENKFLDAINKLKLLIREGELNELHYNNLVIAKSRLDSVENAVSNGTMSHDQETLELNKIRTSILKIIDTAK